MSLRVDQQTPTFGVWTDEPNDDGIYEFDGARNLPSGSSFVTTHCLVQVATVRVAKWDYKVVKCFGRGHHFRLQDFHGKWRKLNIVFRGEVGV